MTWWQFCCFFLTPLLIYNERILASLKNAREVLAFSLLWNVFLSHCTIFPGCYENVVACRRGSTSDDCHSPAISCNCSKIPYGDAVRRTAWWRSCRRYQGLYYTLIVIYMILPQSFKQTHTWRRFISQTCTETYWRKIEILILENIYKIIIDEFLCLLIKSSLV